MNTPISHHRIENVLIRASAGTGKTYQLSNRFLELLRRDQRFDRLLATTFTRKAAGEILERILLRLAEAATDDAKCAQLRHDIADQSTTPSNCLQGLAELTRGLHRLRIGTLDSFFLQLARCYSLELGLAGGWTIAEEMDEAALRVTALDRLLDDHDHDDAARLVHWLSKGEASRALHDLLLSTVKEQYELFLDSPKEAWHRIARPTPLTSVELTDALEELRVLEFQGNGNLARAHREDCRRAREDDWDQFIQKGIAGKIIEGQSVYGKAPIPQDAIRCYQPVIEHARAMLIGRLANRTESAYQLLKRFHVHFQSLKHSRRAYRFDDVTRYLASNFTQDSPADPSDDSVDDGKVVNGKRLAQMAFRMDGAVDHLLLDEFQDTSLAQWQVLRPFASQIAPSEQHGSVFCVGDTKQAIYGWRGGNAGIFETLTVEVDRLEERSLNKSFRSSPVIIEVVNEVFRQLASKHDNLGREYSAASLWQEKFPQHSTARRELPGYVALVTAPQVDVGQQDATLEAAAEQVARLVSEAPDRSVGVLVRTNENLGKIIYRLRDKGVPASEEGGNPVTDSAGVELVISLMKLVDHPGESVSAFHVARSPLGKMLGLDAHDQIAAIGQLTDDLRCKLLDRGYGPTVAEVARMLQGHGTERDRHRLSQLVELSYTYDLRATCRTRDYIQYVRQHRVSDPATAKVRVMTIHQAKGLQFDSVVLPDLDHKILGQPPAFVSHRTSQTGPIDFVFAYANEHIRRLLPAEYQSAAELTDRQTVTEALCVLYVAMTRAVHSLIMVIAPSKKERSGLPKSPAGIIRAGLVGPGRLLPSRTIYEHGDPTWYLGTGSRPSASSTAIESAIDPTSVRESVGRTPDYVGRTPDYVGRTPDYVGRTPDSVGRTPGPSRTAQRVASRQLQASTDDDGPGVRPTSRVTDMDVKPESPAEREPVLAPVTLREAGSLPHFPRRNWQHTSPSQLEGGRRVRLAQRISMESSAGLAYGTIVHAWLEQIHWLDDRAPSDVTLLRIASRLQSDALDIGAMIDEFRKMLHKPEVAALLTKSTYAQWIERRLGHANSSNLAASLQLDVHNEKRIAVRDGTRMLTGNIDRLVLTRLEGKIVAADIIDFKTDKMDVSNDKSVSEKVEFYRPQVEAYRRAVVNMLRLKQRQVSARLLFVGPGIVANL